MILGGAPEPVLRRPQRREIHAAHAGEERRRMAQPRVDRGLVGDERDAPSAEERRALGDEHVEAGPDERHRRRS